MGGRIFGPKDVTELLNNNYKITDSSQHTSANSPTLHYFQKSHQNIGFSGKLRSLAVTLDGETARLQLALQREDSGFEDCPMRAFHDLHSEVQTLKDEVNIILDKAAWKVNKASVS
ncbi:unnamed protein product [Rangifer tarandus platyrhynchus]|uniref:Uncharacterized protein n=1 Tax=Rangifer tarandus platyrhynchus TaxID=3082113 RepID=A0ABN8Y1V4_RANTA|nr:unnamed protein product [Rangifer tarandus platyrhynchus]